MKQTLHVNNYNMTNVIILGYIWHV